MISLSYALSSILSLVVSLFSDAFAATVFPLAAMGLNPMVTSVLTVVTACRYCLSLLPWLGI
jgi:hypothetical protein